MTIAEEKQAQRTAGRAARKALAAPQRAAANAGKPKAARASKAANDEKSVAVKPRRTSRSASAAE